jgi:hypothetical protein
MTTAEYIIKSSGGQIIFDSTGISTEKNKTPRKHKNKKRVIHPELKELSEMCDEEFWEDFFLGASRGSFKEDIKYSNGDFIVKNLKTTHTFTIDKSNLEITLVDLIKFFNENDIYSPDDISKLLNGDNIPRGTELDPKHQREELVDQFFKDKPIKKTIDMVKVQGLKPKVDENGVITIEGVNQDGSLNYASMKISKSKETPKGVKFDIKKKWNSYLKDLVKLKK